MRHPLTIPTDEECARLEDRAYQEKAPGYRTEAQRDRDRIVYSSAFQRLGGVTQVTASEPGHIFHTRLTHSIKVAQFARRTVERFHVQAAGRVEGIDLSEGARRLANSLDPDAAEAVSLGHDLGHPPFGHVGEQALKDATGGDFEGNAQSFRIVTRLAARAPEPAGINLSRQTLNGLLKYPWIRDPTHAEWDDKYGAYRTDETAFAFAREDSPENEPCALARLLDWADDVTYAVHDMDDFYRAGLVPLDRLKRGGREVERFAAALKERGRIKDVDKAMAALQDVLAFFPLEDPYEGRIEERLALRAFGSQLITVYLEALSLEDSKTEGKVELVIEETAADQVAVLKALSWEYVVERPSLAVMQHGHANVVTFLYQEYFNATDEQGDVRIIPPAFRHRVEKNMTDGARTHLALDLVSSLTERDAIELYRRMTGVAPGSLLDAAARIV
jgi:dGTPase